MVSGLRTRLTYYRTRAFRMKNEQWGCGTPQDMPVIVGTTPIDTLKRAEEPHADWLRAREADVGDTIIGGGKVLKEIPGAGKVYDWRDSSWTPTNGGPIRPLIFVQHIPVVPNIAGIADFVRLRDVLVAQGLMVHSATDREGNVAWFTPFDFLNYHARGANSFSCGCEHMHISTAEDWTERQFRAAAWLVNQAKNKHDIPAGNADLATGNGVVRVNDKGQCSHQRVSWAAGYNDRSDPGPGYDFGHVRELVIYYREHESFVGAPTL